LTFIPSSSLFIHPHLNPPPSLRLRSGQALRQAQDRPFDFAPFGSAQGRQGKQDRQGRGENRE